MQAEMKMSEPNTLQHLSYVDKLSYWGKWFIIEIK